MKNNKKKAVALHYDVKKDNAPKRGAGGSGFIAEKIINLAKEHNIPIYCDKDLCEVLLNLNPNTNIPEELYEIVAKILVFIYNANLNYIVSKD